MPKKILDEFSDLPISRNAKFHRRNIKKKLCACGQKRVIGASSCKRCRTKINNLARKKYARQTQRGHYMLTRFTSINDEKEYQETNYYEQYRAKQPENLFWLCNCLHFDVAHINSSRKCRLVWCKCTNFTPKEFKIEISITKLDIFQFENKDLVFDSPNFWLEYENWDKNYDPIQY